MNSFESLGSTPAGDASDKVQIPRLFSWRGRIGRLRFFVYACASALCFMALAVLGLFITFGMGLAVQRSQSVFGAVGFLGVFGFFIVSLIYFVFNVFILIQRSHDMGWNGWTVIIACIFPLATLVWLFKPGDAGANVYGAPPIPNSNAIRIFSWVFGVLIVLVFLMPDSVNY
jgi:uncharacterized membrane protein YhaH (DUF805 family)